MAMNPKKDAYMRGYGDGFKDGRKSVLPALRNLADEMSFLLSRNPGKDGGLYRRRLDEADAVISQSPVGAVSPSSPICGEDH